jgi:hypothetical protein
MSTHLRAMMRSVEDLNSILTQEKNRGHALAASKAMPSLLIRELKKGKCFLIHRVHSSNGCDEIPTIALCQNRCEL